MCQTLYHVIIAVLMGDEKCAPQWAIVGVQTVLGKDLLVMIEVVVIDRPVKCHYDHLRCLELFDDRLYHNCVSISCFFLRQISEWAGKSRSLQIYSIYLVRLKTTGDDRPVTGTEAIRKLTIRRVASLSQVCRRLGDWCRGWKLKDTPDSCEDCAQDSHWKL